jgi:hypothetical protein
VRYLIPVPAAPGGVAPAKPVYLNDLSDTKLHPSGDPI